MMPLSLSLFLSLVARTLATLHLQKPPRHHSRLLLFWNFRLFPSFSHVFWSSIQFGVAYRFPAPNHRQREGERERERYYAKERGDIDRGESKTPNHGRIMRMAAREGNFWPLENRHRHFFFRGAPVLEALPTDSISALPGCYCLCTKLAWRGAAAGS